MDKLIAAGERERLGRRHSEYFRDQAQDADKRYGTGSTLAWLAEVELELDNYRSALEWGLSQGHDAVVGAAIAGALEQLWFRGGLAVEGRYWIEPALKRMNVAENPQIAARLWRALASLHYAKRTCEAAERAVSLYESAGDGHGVARALASLGWGLYKMGRLDEASETNMRALTALREYGDKGGVAGCLRQQGAIAIARGATAEARDLYAQALDAFKALRDETGTARVLGNLAELELADGHVEQALRLADESLEIHALGKDAIGLLTAYVNIAAYRIALGDVGGAREAAREGLRWARQEQSALGMAIALQHFALLGALRGEVRSAAHLVGYVKAQYKELGYEREPTEQWGYEKLMASLREHLSEAEIEKLAAEGAAWSEDRAVEEALKFKLGDEAIINCPATPDS